MKKLILGILAVLVVLIVFVIGYMGYFFQRAGAVSKGEPIVASDVDTPALLVIDIQEGITGTLASSFTEGFAQQAEPFIQNVNAAIEKAEEQNIPVIYIRQENKDKIINLLTGGKMLKAGTAATMIDARVKIVQGPVFMKQVGDSFSNQQFDIYLRGNKINHLYMTGLSATQCVYKTIRGALQRGYTVTAISDAVIADTVEKKEAVLEQYKQEGVEVMKLEEWK